MLQTRPLARGAENFNINEQLHTPRPSRSPSATESSEPAAEYGSGPFRAFLKGKDRDQNNIQS
jgi:hypothetical protein